MSEECKAKMLTLDRNGVQPMSLGNPRHDDNQGKANSATVSVSFIKTLTWSSLGLLILYLLTGTWEISLTFIGVRTILYFIHERLWACRNISFHSGPHS